MPVAGIAAGCVGGASTVTLMLTGLPAQPLALIGVMVYVTTAFTEPVFFKISLMVVTAVAIACCVFPVTVPLVRVDVHVYFNVLGNTKPVAMLLQIVLSATVSTGKGLTVTDKLKGVPGQPLAVGVMV